jgi:hypothetical protein
MSVNINDLDRAIIPFVSKALNKQLDPQDVIYIQKRIRGNNYEITPVTQLVLNIVNDIKHTQVESIDLEDYNQEEVKLKVGEDAHTYRQGTHALGSDTFNKQLVIDVTNFMEFTKESLFDLSRAMNPASKEYYSYVMFDSNNRNTSLSTDGTLVWQLNDGPVIFQTGIINLYNKLHPITKMRLGRLTFSNLKDTEFDKLKGSTSKRFAVTIPDFQSQALVHPSGNRFHFIQQLLALNYAADPTLSSFFENRGWFRFHEPHRNTSQLSLRVADMFTLNDPVIVHDDRQSIAAFQSFGVTVASFDFGIVFDPLFVPADQVENMVMLYGSISATGRPETNAGAFTVHPFTMSGFTTNTPANPAQAALIAAYNSTWVLSKVHSNIFQAPTPVTTANLPVGLHAVEMTHMYPPRLTGVLELVSEIPPGEKIV